MSASDRPPDNASELSVPLILGVTAHREIRPEYDAKVRAAVQEILVSYRRRYVHTPVKIMTALAEGGDMLCAEVALACEIDVFAALPFPAQVYRASTAFSSNAARERFDALLQNSRVTCFTTSPTDVTGNAAIDWTLLAKDARTRKQIYSTNGHFIARTCHALIAVWDGIPPTSAGGTGDIVMAKVKGTHIASTTEPDRFQWPNPGVVHHVWCPRELGSEAEARAGQRRDVWRSEDLEPGGAGRPGAPSVWSVFERNHWAIGERIDRLNQRLQAARNLDVLPVAASPVRGEAIRKLGLFRDAAAAASRQLSREVRSVVRLVFALAFIAVLALTLYDRSPVELAAGPHHEPLWLLTFLLSMLACALAIRSLRRTEMEELDYRILAEALRTAYYWGCAGIDQPVSDHYLQQLSGELGWTRQAMQAIVLPAPSYKANFEALSDVEKLSALSEMRRSWVGEQLHYFRDAHALYRQRSRRCHRVGLFLAGTGWTLAAAPFLFALPKIVPLAPHGFLLTVRELWRAAAHPIDTLSTVAGLLVVAGALILAFGERRLYEEFARQYARAAELYIVADKELERLLAEHRIAAARDLVFRLGRESLAENADWLVLRRNRPIEMPIA